MDKFHKRYASMNNFFVAQKGARFPYKDYQFLKKWGYWLWALSTGVIFPITDKQKHFVKVMMGNATPTSYYEDLWINWLKKSGNYKPKDRKKQSPYQEPQVDSLKVFERWRKERSFDGYLYYTDNSGVVHYVDNLLSSNRKCVMARMILKQQ